MIMILDDPSIHRLACRPILLFGISLYPHDKCSIPHQLNRNRCDRGHVVISEGRCHSFAAKAALFDARVKALGESCSGNGETWRNNNQMTVFWISKL